MAQNFSCPSCGAPLDYEGGGQPTIQCPYCFTSVIVPQELRGQRAERVSSDITMSLQGQAAKLRELANLVRAGQRDKAAEMYQQIYRVTPEEAQRVIGQLSGSGAVVVSTTSPVGGVHVSTPYGYSSMNAGMPGGVTYTPTPQVVYSGRARQGQRSPLVWIIFAFVGFMICMTVVTTVIPIILAFIGAFIPFFIQ